MKKLVLILVMFIALINLNAAEVEFIKSNEIEKCEVNDILYLGYSNKVSNINLLRNELEIKKINLEGTALIKDYSFIKKCKNVEVLILNDVSIENLKFLEECPNLKIISLDSVKFKNLSNFSKLKNLEFLSITNCGLTDIKKVLKHEKKLLYVNLAHNKISALPKLHFSDKAKYFVAGNEIKKSTNKSYIFEDITLFLPDDYKIYLR